MCTVLTSVSTRVNTLYYSDKGTGSTKCCPNATEDSRPCGEDKQWGKCVDTTTDSTFSACAKSHQDSSRWFFPWTSYCKCNPGRSGPGCADPVATQIVKRKDYVLGLTAAERELYAKVYTNMLKKTKKYRHPIGALSPYGFNIIAAGIIDILQP